MSKIISIGTAVPDYKHKQEDILEFMNLVYAFDKDNGRKIKFLYRQSGIGYRYSVIPDYSLPAAAWQFYPASENLEPFPSLELRMQWFGKHAATLSLRAIRECLNKNPGQTITHLITVSCTGMSAPGLDLELMELLDLPKTIHRTSVNFMGCYAAIHAMKMADAFCNSVKDVNVLIVCTELCTLHFQKEATQNNITSSMLFGDGAAALLISNNKDCDGLNIGPFYSLVDTKGKQDMAWELSSKGFLMTLSGYVPDLIEKDFNKLVDGALSAAELDKEQITDWCIHPGGKKILEAVSKSLDLANGQLDNCYDVLRDYGNMSSPSILFVLQKIMKAHEQKSESRIFGAAFGPGITMETFILTA